MESNTISNNNSAEYVQLYKDQLQILSIKKCLYFHNSYVKSQNYEENYAQGELIDHRNKHIESCLNQVYTLHSVFIDELMNE